MSEADDDFAQLKPAGKGDGDKHGSASGQKRKWLMVYETLPSQVLNMYGAAKYIKMKDGDVWKHMSKPLKTGAAYMTELADESDERRGTGLNRWLQIVLGYCKTQKDPEQKKRNDFVLKPEVVTELYQEIDDVVEHLQNCLAPKKGYKAKEGAASLRSSGTLQLSEGDATVDEVKILASAKVVYEWLTKKQSRVRMLINWQAEGGLSFCASIHHRAARCFVSHGNQYHDKERSDVTLEEFQKAVVCRHRVGNDGVDDAVHNEADFQEYESNTE